MYFFRFLDLTIGRFMPGWVSTLLVSAIFSAWLTSVLMTVPALASLDLSWYWSVTSRSLFGVFTLLFCTIIISKGSQ